MICRGNRPMMLPSENYMAWHKDQSYVLIKHKIKNPIERCVVELTFFSPDLRAGDLTNKAESIMDLLVDRKFLKDDNWFVVNRLHLYYGGLDRENPRVDIKIIPIGKEQK